jgi:hypothetical protein
VSEGVQGLLKPGQRPTWREASRPIEEVKIEPGEVTVDLEEMKVELEEVKVEPGEVKVEPGEVKVEPGEVKVEPGEVKVDLEEVKIETRTGGTETGDRAVLGVAAAMVRMAGAGNWEPAEASLSVSLLPLLLSPPLPRLPLPSVRPDRGIPLPLAS